MCSIFGGKFCVNFSQEKWRLKFVTANFTTFFTASKEMCYLDFTLGAFACKNRGFAKGWFPKGWFWQMFPGTKTGTRVHSDVPRHQKPDEGTFGCSLVPKPERGYIRQNRPFTKPPFCFLSKETCHFETFKECKFKCRF